MNTVPFKFSKVYAGFGEGEGLLRDGGDHLLVEFQLKDALVGVVKSAVRQVRVPLREVASLTLTKGWLGTSWLGVTIVIQAQTMEAIKDVPTASQGRVELSVARRDREAAERFVAELHEHEGPDG